jgi:ParB family chromosome partitioning protein
MVPVRVRVNKENEMILIDGERRLRATLAAISEGAEIASIPALMERKTLNELDAMVLALTANMGEPLSIVDEAHAIKRLNNYGLKPEDIAKKLGKSIPTIYNRLKMCDASPEVLGELEDGNLTAGEVREIINNSDSIEEQKENLNKTKEKKAKKKASGEKKAGKKEYATLLMEAVEWMTELNQSNLPQVQELIERINAALDNE